MPEIRNNPLRDEWTIMSTQRSNRPLEFSAEENWKTSPEDCPFCEGREDRTPPEIAARREGGTKNGPGWSIRVVPNKYSALDPEATNSMIEDDLYSFTDGFGFHELVIEGPDHQKKFPDKSAGKLKEIVEVYRARFRKLAEKSGIKSVLIFKNFGPESGASSSHPHSQIIATPFTSTVVSRETRQSRKYKKRKGRCLLCDEISEELKSGKRIIHERENFLSYAPFASRSPYEIRVLPRDHESDFGKTKDDLLEGFAGMLKECLLSLRRLLGNISYNFYLHSAPTNNSIEEVYSSFHWHVAIVPRLSYLAGFELGSGNPINPVSPEKAAEDLSNC